MKPHDLEIVTNDVDGVCAACSATHGEGTIAIDLLGGTDHGLRQA